MRLLCVLLVLLGGTVLAQIQAGSFTDIGQSRYQQAITLLQQRGLIGGFPDGTFRPLQAMTRAEYLAMVLRASGRQDTPVAGQCLADFADGAWYAPVMCQGLALGLISGTGPETRPQDTVIFAEALKMVIGALGLPVEDGEDVWFSPYVDYAAQHGILSVLEYRPRDFVTREVAANILYRSLVVAGEVTSSVQLPTPSAEVGPEPAAEAPLFQAEPADVPLTEPVLPPEPAETPVAAPEPVQSCAPGQAGVAPRSLTVSGRERSLLTHLPETVSSGRPLSLVVAFHGRTNSNQQVQNYMRLDPNAGDTIVVYPAGMPAGSGAFNWHDPGDAPAELRDYELFDAIVESFTDRFCIDSSRIFVVGHSLGAYFANSLACARGHVIRAVASVAGGILPSTCTGNIGVLLFHNPNDALVLISEGERARDTFLAVNESAGHSPQALGDAFNCRVYNVQDREKSVTWCPHSIDRPYGDRYDPHSWPSSIGAYVMDWFRTY